MCLEYKRSVLTCMWCIFPKKTIIKKMHKGIVHPKNENSISTHTNLWVSFFCWTQKKIFRKKHVTKQLTAAIDLHSIFIFRTMEVNGYCQFVNLSFEKQYIFLAWNWCRVDRPVPQFNGFDLVVSTPLTSHDLKTVNMLIAIWFSPNYFDSFNITNCVYETICQNQFVLGRWTADYLISVSSCPSKARQVSTRVHYVLCFLRIDKNWCDNWALSWHDLRLRMNGNDL